MFVSFQIAGVIILFILVSFFLAQARITLKSGRFFLMVCATTFLLLFFDIFSIVCIISPDIFSRDIAKFFCKVYLVFLVLEATLGLAYSVKDIYKYNIKKVKIFYTFHLFYIILAICLLLPTDINMVYEADKQVLYTEGISCYLCYILSAVAIITTIVFVIVNGKKLNKSNRDSVLIWMLFWLIAAGTQFFFKHLLLVSFASCIALVIIYINLENPALRLDKKTAKFNFEVLDECLTELTDKKDDYKLVYMILNNNSIDAHLKNLALMSISNILSTFADNKFLLRRNKFLTFRGELGFVVVILNATVNDFFSEMEKGFKNTNYQKLYGNVYDIKYLIIDNNQIVQSYDTVKSLFHSILEKNLIPLNHERNYIGIDTVKKIDKIQEMEKTINYAIDNDLIEVFYQPIYSKAKERFTSAEALVRIKDKDNNIIYPTSFIEIAERNGLISKLGEMVFEHVCRLIKNVNIKALGLDYIEVNLSVVQCGDPNLANTYIKIMNDYNVDPKQINLEITETASSNLRNIMLNNMEKLIEYGVSFSLDDFGMGNSNINYIIEMPVEIVKFDKVLVDSYFSDPKAKLVVDKIIEMIKALNLELVLEGIEEKDILEQALKLDIDYIQGYFFSKPIPTNEFIDFIKDKNKK